MALSKDKELELYREQMGVEKAAKQAELARTTCKRCGGKDGRHHPACRWKP